MSYRSIKRVLGESSLERKCLILFGASLFVLITGSFWWYGNSTSELVKESSRERARGLVDAIRLTVHFEWWTNTNEKGQDRLGLVKSLEEGVSTGKNRKEFIHLVADGEHAPRDKFEEDVVKKFLALSRDELLERAKSETLPYEERTVNNEYQYYTPQVFTDKNCIACHFEHEVNTGFVNEMKLGDINQLQPGDLISVLKVSLPDEKTQIAMSQNNSFLIGAAILTVFLAMLASYAIVRYIIVKPLAHLRDVSDRISHGDIALRADLHTGDEFEKLATAFNRMLRQLATNQEELKDVNDHLNVKVDELAQANMQLYEMNRLKSDFLATMSHELRTPLNAIIGFSDVLESIASLEEKQKRYVKNIRTSGKVLLEMINDILDLAKIESGKMQVRLADFSIEPVVAAQCDMARPLTERKNIDLDVQIEPEQPDLFQDQAKVQQILNNLLSNAIKFTPEGGRIVVAVRRGDAGELVLQVSDTGVGIAPEDQVAIFEKFRQGKSVLTGGDAMTREYSGTGLGLSIVKELCKLLGGEISLESELGKGSTFTVRLPWIRPDQPKPDAGLTAPADESTRQRHSEQTRALEAPAAMG